MVKKLTRVEETAIEWIVRRSSGKFSKLDQKALEVWLAESPENLAAYTSALETWDLMGAAGALKIKAKSSDEVSTKSNKIIALPKDFKSALRPSLALAATILIAFLGSKFLSFETNVNPVLPPRTITEVKVESQTYQANIGEIKPVALSDGSTIFLNSGARVRVSLSEENREVNLLSGEAFFSVAPDAEKPFQVTAGNIVTTVLGTEFLVEKKLTEISVTVSSGNVSVKRTIRGKVSGEVFLISDQKVVWRESEESVEVEEVDAATEKAWVSGKLIFNDDFLGEVVLEISRYTDKLYAIEDPDLAKVRITGNFDLENPEAIIEFLKIQFNLGEVTSGNKTILVKEKNQ